MQLNPHFPRALCTALNVKKGQLYKHERCQNYSNALLGASSHSYGKSRRAVVEKSKADDKIRILGTRRKTEAPPTHPNQEEGPEMISLYSSWLYRPEVKHILL